MIHLADALVLDDLRMTDHLSASEDGGARNVFGFEAREPLGGAAPAQNFLGQLESRVDVALAERRRAKALVGQPLRTIESPRERLPLPIGLHRDADVTVAGLVDQVDEARGFRLRHLVAHERLARHVRRPQKHQQRVAIVPCVVDGL